MSAVILITVYEGVVTNVCCDDHTVDIYIHDMDNPSLEEADVEYPHPLVLQSTIKALQDELEGNSPATDGTGLHGSDQGKVQGDSEVQQRDDREGSGIGAGRIKAGNDGNFSNVSKEWEPSPYYDFNEEHGEGGTLSGCVSS